MLFLKKLAATILIFLLSSLLFLFTLEKSIFSFIFGIGIVIFVFFASAFLYSFKIGFFTSLILLSTLLFNLTVYKMTSITAFAFFINLSLFSFILGYEKRKDIFIYLFYISMAFAVMAKGIIGFILPFLIAFLFILIKDFKFLKEMKFIKGLFFFFIIILIWCGFLFYKTREIPNFYQLLEFKRGNEKFYLYLFLPLFCFPWIGLLPHLLFIGYKQIINKQLTNPEIFFWLWLLLFIIFFFSTSQSIYFFSVILPSISFLLAISLEKMTDWAIKILLYFNAFLGLLLLFVGGAFFAHLEPKLAWISFFGFLPILNSYFGFFFYNRNKIINAFLLQLLSGYGFILFLNYLWLPFAKHYNLVKSILG